MGRPDLIVCAGLVLSESGEHLLLTSRPPGKVYAGWLECPGGKQEPTESLEQMLHRELEEELGLRVHEQAFAFTIEHSYAHANVTLHFFWVSRWSADNQAMLLPTASAREGQQLCWITDSGPTPFPLLPATLPVLERVRNRRG